MAAITSKRLPLKEFLKQAADILETKVTRKTIHHYVYTRHWYDGFVVFKNQATGRYHEGSISDLREWINKGKKHERTPC